MYPQLTALILFGIVTGFSPGPNNIMTSYCAFNYGFRKTIPTMLGVITGWTVLIVILEAGSIVMFQKFNDLQFIVKIFGSVYLLYMAYKIFITKIDSINSVMKPVTFLSTFFFQFINPKSIVVGLITVSTFIDAQNNYLRDCIVVTIVFFFMAVGSQLTWCLMGKYLKKFASSQKFTQNFNYTMSFLLIVCVIMFYV